MTHLPPWAIRLLGELDAADQRARELVSGLTVEQLNWRAEPGRWSVGQCIDHLCVANDVYLPPIAAALAGQSTAPAQEITIGWFGRWFLRSYIEPSPETKQGAAPKKIVPAGHVDLSVLDRFLAGNRTVREVVRRAAAHDVNRIRFRNPFVPVIRFTVGTGLQIITSHQRRHLLQAEKVKLALLRLEHRQVPQLP